MLKWRFWPNVESQRCNWTSSQSYYLLSNLVFDAFSLAEFTFSRNCGRHNGMVKNWLSLIRVLFSPFSDCIIIAHRIRRQFHAVLLLRHILMHNQHLQPHRPHHTAIICIHNWMWIINCNNRTKSNSNSSTTTTISNSTHLSKDWISHHRTAQIIIWDWRRLLQAHRRQQSAHRITITATPIAILAWI